MRSALCAVWHRVTHYTLCPLEEPEIALAACGKTRFDTLEQKGLTVRLVTTPFDSHRLTLAQPRT
jgi:hypothetical protein